MIPYSRQHITEADIKEVVKVLRSDFLTRGPKVPEFEKALAAYAGVKHAVVFSSATTALYALMDLLPGKSVVTTPYTFVATTNCVLAAKKKLILHDIDPNTFNIKPEGLPHADILIAVDFAGNPCDYDALRKHHRGIIVADAAHSFGGSLHGKKVGSLADYTVLSFHPVKTITCGEGGAVLTNDSEMVEKLKLYRNHGLDSKRNQVLLGNNYHMTDFQAALGISQLKRIDKVVKKREELAVTYLANLAGVKRVKLPWVTKGAKSAWHLFPIKVVSEHPQVLIERLEKAGFKSQRHYKPIHWNPYYKNHMYFGDINATECYFSELSLPLHPGMTKKQVRKVCKIIKEALSEGDLCA